MQLKSIITGSMAICCCIHLSCGDTTKLPSSTPNTTATNSTVPLSKEWRDKLSNVQHDPNRIILEKRLKELNAADREVMLKVISYIDKDEMPGFLAVFATFDQPSQAKLLQILIFLQKEDEKKDDDLLKDLLDPNKELSLKERLKLWSEVNELSDKDQELIKQFNNLLNEDPEEVEN